MLCHGLLWVVFLQHRNVSPQHNYDETEIQIEIKDVSEDLKPTLSNRTE